MTNDFPEADWKILSRLKPLALERLCQRVLQESGSILERATEGASHSAYLELYKHIHASDETMSTCFDDWKRSQALNILISWRLAGLLTEDEFNAFSSSTRTIVDGFSKQR